MAQFGDRDALRNVDRVYRRGLVLGLTVAEVFLLLLFLLLLALAGTALRWSDQIRKTEAIQEDNRGLEKDLDEARNDLAALSYIKKTLATAGLDPNQITTLIESTRERARLSREIDELLTEVNELKPLAEAGQELEELRIETGLSPEELAQLKSDYDALKPLADVGREFGEIEKDTGVTLDDLRDKGENLKEALIDDSQIGSLTGKIAELETELERLSIVANSKGIDPPCWYDEILLDSGEARERPIKLFDVAVFNDYMLVRDRPVPQKYADEKRSLPLTSVRFMYPLSDQDFLGMMRPIRRMAKEEKLIRAYGCVFFVNVWDKTSRDAKESGAMSRWSRATEGTIGAVFYRDTVRTEAWEAASD